MERGRGQGPSNMRSIKATYTCLALPHPTPPHPIPSHPPSTQTLDQGRSVSSKPRPGTGTMRRMDSSPKPRPGMGPLAGNVTVYFVDSLALGFIPFVRSLSHVVGSIKSMEFDWSKTKSFVVQVPVMFITST